MSFKSKSFLVLTLGDTESWGYDEITLPILLDLVDASAPDYRMFTNTGVVANYLPSPNALTAVEEIIARAESLRDNDPRFTTLGIGLAQGELSAEFDWLGRLKPGTDRPLGTALADAVRVEREPLRYREILKKLRQKTNGPAA